MAEVKSEPASVGYYFVDEAGDSTIYGGKGKNKGKILIGTEGVSYYFMLGILDVPNPKLLSGQLRDLHKEILNDPYFKNVPSLQPENRKTAIAFHAKDDLPEVRREVFRLLTKQEGLRFFAVVRDKHRVREEFETHGKRYKPIELYDHMIRRAFKERLHQKTQYDIFFAKRGASDRTNALRDAIEKAKQNFSSSWNKSADSAINIYAVPATDHYCLQAADYILWALQRLYEKREKRYFEYVREIYSLIHDVDDIRENKKGEEYGVYYSKTKPLNPDLLPPPKSIP